MKTLDVLVVRPVTHRLIRRISVLSFASLPAIVPKATTVRTESVSVVLRPCTVAIKRKAVLLVPPAKPKTTRQVHALNSPVLAVVRATVYKARLV